MAVALGKAIEQKLEAFKRAKGAVWRQELERLLDAELERSIDAVMARASAMTEQQALAILDKPRESTTPDREAARIARRAVLGVRKRKTA